MGEEVFASFEQLVLEKIGKPRQASLELVATRGKLLVDATDAEQSRRYQLLMTWHFYLRLEYSGDISTEKYQGADP